MGKANNIRAIPGGLDPQLTGLLRELREAVQGVQGVVHSTVDPIVTKSALQKAIVGKVSSTKVTAAVLPDTPMIEGTQQVDGGLELTITTPTYVGHAETQIFRSAADDVVANAQQVGTLLPPATSFTDANTEPNTDYRYYLYNVNVNGDVSQPHNVDGLLAKTGPVGYSNLKNDNLVQPDNSATAGAIAGVDLDMDQGTSVLVNVLGIDALATTTSAGGKHSYTGFGVGTAGMTLAKLGTLVGNSISVRGFIQCATGAATNPRYTVTFYDNTGTVISSQDTEVSNATTLATVKADDIGIPANTVYIGFATNWDALGGDTITFGPATMSLGAQSIAPHPAQYRHGIDTADQVMNGSNMAVVRNYSLSNNQIDLSKVATGAGTGIETAINFDTKNISDGANLGVTGDLTQVSNLPATVAAAQGLGMLTDAQTALPTTVGTRQTFFSDNGGMIYSGNEYDTNVNFAARALANGSGTGSFAVWDVPIAVPNPGQAVNIVVTVSGNMNSSANYAGSVEAEYSIDGGSTWVAGPGVGGGIVGPSGTTILNVPFTASVFAQGVTPTGDVLARALIKDNSGSIAFVAGFLTLELKPVSSFYVAAPLAPTVPATRTMNCTTTFPTTTCTATGTVTCSVPSGVGPFSYSWAKTAGTGSILSGSTSQTVTLTDTETTASPGATHTTTVVCTVQDSQTYVSTAGSQTGGIATITIGAHFIPSPATVNASGFTPAAYNGTGLAVTGVTATAIKYAVSGAPGAVTVQGVINAVKVASGSCVMTGTFNRAYPPMSVSVTGNASTSCNGPGGSNCTTSNTLTSNATGGDGSYTYSNTKTSGTGTDGNSILTGATAKVFTVGGLALCGGPSSTGTYKSTVTDGHSNTNNGSKTVTFQYF